MTSLTPLERLAEALQRNATAQRALNRAQTRLYWTALICIAVIVVTFLVTHWGQP